MFSPYGDVFNQFILCSQFFNVSYVLLLSYVVKNLWNFWVCNIIKKFFSKKKNKIKEDPMWLLFIYNLIFWYSGIWTMSVFVKKIKKCLLIDFKTFSGCDY